MRVLIVGAGYTGFQLAANLVQRGHEVTALSRRAGSRPELRTAGVWPVEADITKPESLAPLPRDWDWVVNCVSSSRGTIEEYRNVYLEGTRNLLSWLSQSPLQRFIYTSSTGVYGQDDGSVVTERSPAVPESETGKILVEAENMLLSAAREQQFPAITLRVSGIYGPGRAYWLKKFMEGGASDDSGERIINMVHCDDVVGAIVAALEKGETGKIYNVTDNEPVSQRELFRWLAERVLKNSELQAPSTIRLRQSATAGQGEAPNSKLQHDSPERDMGKSSEAGRRRRATNKRVSNVRLRTELGYEFRYPTFREGFAAILS